MCRTTDPNNLEIGYKKLCTFLTGAPCIYATALVAEFMTLDLESLLT